MTVAVMGRTRYQGADGPVVLGWRDRCGGMRSAARASLEDLSHAARCRWVTIVNPFASHSKKGARWRPDISGCVLDHSAAGRAAGCCCSASLAPAPLALLHDEGVAFDRDLRSEFMIARCPPGSAATMTFSLRPSACRACVDGGFREHAGRLWNEAAEMTSGLQARLGDAEQNRVALGGLLASSFIAR